MSNSTTLVNAASAGIISPASQTAIETELDDIALTSEGVNIDEIDSEEATLVHVAIDASASMYDHTDAIINAYKQQFLDPLRKAQNANSILVATSVFSSGGGPNVRLIHGYTPIPQCPDLTLNDYNPNGMTPLFDAVFQGISGLVTYGQDLRDNGTRTKSIVIVMSDGWENASSVGQSKVRRLSEDVLKAQEFVLAYIFFGEESEGDNAAKDIGFPIHHRLTSNLDATGIRRVFGTVSASVISTSQAQVSSGSLSSNAFFQTN